MVSQQLSALIESRVNPDVIVLALPIPLIEKLVNAKNEEDAEGADEEEEEEVCGTRSAIPRLPAEVPSC
jgi:hypothetical protein